MRVLNIIFGTLFAILLLGNVFLINEPWWANTFLGFIDVKNLDYHLNLVLFISWIQLPPTILLSLTGALIVSRTGYPRYFVYSFLLFAFLDLVVFPYLPVVGVFFTIFSIEHLINVIVTLALFLTLFVSFLYLVKKYNKQIMAGTRKHRAPHI